MFRALAAAVAALLVALPALAAEEPDVVYGKFHRAIATGNLEEVLKYAPAARRAEMAAMSPAQKEAQLKMLGVMLPRAFTLMSKTISQSGRTARVLVTGEGRSLVTGGQREQLFGDARLVNENGEWKVDELSWGPDRPAGTTPARQATPAAAEKSASKPASKSTAVQPSAPAVRKLGEAKPECVFKPVMTAEDLERCR